METSSCRLCVKPAVQTPDWCLALPPELAQQRCSWRHHGGLTVARKVCIPCEAPERQSCCTQGQPRDRASLVMSLLKRVGVRR